MSRQSPEEITLTIHLGQGLRRLAGDVAVIEMRVPAGTLIGEVIERLGLAPGDVTIISHNGALAGKDDAVGPGDNLGLYPPIGGG